MKSIISILQIALLIGAMTISPAKSIRQNYLKHFYSYLQEAGTQDQATYFNPIQQGPQVTDFRPVQSKIDELFRITDRISIATFNIIDCNHQGFINAQDFKNLAYKWTQVLQLPIVQMQGLFDLVDTDQNGQVTQAEFSAFAHQFVNKIINLGSQQNQQQFQGQLNSLEAQLSNVQNNKAQCQREYEMQQQDLVNQIMNIKAQIGTIMIQESQDFSSYPNPTYPQNNMQPPAVYPNPTYSPNNMQPPVFYPNSTYPVNNMQPNPVNQNQDNGEAMAYFVFQLLDCNHNGYVDRDELRKIVDTLEPLLNFFVDEKFNRVDIDNDGTLNFQEFKDLLKSFEAGPFDFMNDDNSNGNQQLTGGAGGYGPLPQTYYPPPANTQNPPPQTYYPADQMTGEVIGYVPPLQTYYPPTQSYYSVGTTYTTAPNYPAGTTYTAAPNYSAGTTYTAAPNYPNYPAGTTYTAASNYPADQMTGGAVGYALPSQTYYPPMQTYYPAGTTYTAASNATQNTAADYVFKSECSFQTENQLVTLQCPTGFTINVDMASYGTPLGECPDWSQNDFCHAQDSFSIVQKMCNNQNPCIFNVNNALFGDPCVGTYKQFFVSYTCTAKP